MQSSLLRHCSRLFGKATLSVLNGRGISQFPFSFLWMLVVRMLRKRLSSMDSLLSAPVVLRA